MAGGRFAPLDDQVRAAILIDIEARQLGRNAIARKHGVGLGTVSDIAKAAGIHDAFDRTRTARATADRQADMRSRRATMAEDALDDAERIRDRFFDAYTVVVTGPTGSDTITLDVPDAASLRNLVTSYAVLIDKHIALDRHDSDGGMAELGSMLDGLIDKFGLRGPTTTPPDGPAEPSG
jgi:hypothetical protein